MQELVHFLVWLSANNPPVQDARHLFDGRIPYNDGTVGQVDTQSLVLGSA